MRGTKARLPRSLKHTYKPQTTQTNRINICFSGNLCVN